MKVRHYECGSERSNKGGRVCFEGLLLSSYITLFSERKTLGNITDCKIVRGLL